MEKTRKIYNFFIGYELICLLGFIVLIFTKYDMQNGPYHILFNMIILFATFIGYFLIYMIFREKGIKEGPIIIMLMTINLLLMSRFQ